jgi:hypothetical protein
MGNGRQLMERGNRSMKWFGFGSRAGDQTSVKGTKGTAVKQAALQPVLLSETAEALKIKRWERQRDGEFRGFGSHPGRF